MQLFTLNKTLEWGTLDLPLLGISTDWYGRDLNPPAAFTLASDGVNLWFVASRQAPARIHPDTGGGSFTPELWKYDVAELFIADADGTGYLEFNLAANGAWWACRFDSVRKAAPLQPDFAGSMTTHHDPPQPGSWLAALVVPIAFLKEHISFDFGNRANVAFILNSPDQTLHSASKLPGNEPDFHQPQAFQHLVPTTAPRIAPIKNDTEGIKLLRQDS
jgi:hypothetical protein